MLIDKKNNKNNQIIRIAGSNVELIKNKTRATLQTVYGIGRVRANKINTLLLNHPLKKDFKKKLVYLSQDVKAQRIFKALTNDVSLKLMIYSNLERLVRISCYKAMRMLQNLPSKGQRTHTNAGTPSRLNPFLALGVKQNITKELITNNKKWELNWNGRSSDLLDYTEKTASKKYSRKASLEKKKKQLQKLAAKASKNRKNNKKK